MFVAAALLVGGCANDAPPTVPESFEAIVVFAADAGDPAAPGFLSRLSADTGLDLGYRRAMSGGAYVIEVVAPASETLGAALGRLTGHPKVLAAEINRRFTRQ